jgi:hypothetical protein
MKDINKSIFCAECKYYKSKNFLDIPYIDRCKHNRNRLIETLAVKPKKSMSYCKDVNKKNNCTLFEPKISFINKLVNIDHMLFKWITLSHRQKEEEQSIDKILKNHLRVYTISDIAPKETVVKLNTEDILSMIYGAGISLSINWEADGEIEWTLGSDEFDPKSGTKVAEKFYNKHFGDIHTAIIMIADDIVMKYPSSLFVLWWKIYNMKRGEK